MDVSPTNRPEPGAPGLTTMVVSLLAMSIALVALVWALVWLATSAGSEGSEPGAALYAAARTDPAAGAGRAAAHRREVFEQRRARFESRTQLANAAHSERPDR